MLIVEKYLKKGKKWNIPGNIPGNIPYRDKFEVMGWRWNSEIE